MKKLAVVFALVLAALLAVTAYADDPVISIDFADDANGVELVNAEIVDDVTRGKVLKVNGQGNGTARTSYGLYKTDIFENTNWENGLTVSMWVQTDVGSSNLSGTAPIFSIDAEAVPQGYIAAVCSLETTMNTDGNQPETGISPRCWNDPVNVSGGQNKTDEGLWELITVVYEPDTGNIKLYTNDELYATQTLGGGSIDMMLFQLEFYNLIHLGSWNCAWWNYGDYQGLIDDVAIWATALTEDDVVDHYEATRVKQTVVVKAPTVEELYTAEEHTPVYTLDFEDASAVELVGAELVDDEYGKALKVSGTGVGTQGASYGLVTTDLFKNTDWTNGMTISLKVKAAQSDTLTGMAPIYSLDIGNQGYIGLVNSLQSGINTDGNEDIGIVPRFWNDPGNQGGSVNETRIGEWDLVTVVYNNDGANNMAIYCNGESVVRPGINLGTQFGEGTNEQFFTEQLKMVYSLRLGSWLCAWWNNGDYEGLIDDVEIYNVALNPLEAKYLYTGAPAAEEAAPAAEKTISLPKTEFGVGEAIPVTATGEGTDWVGVYAKGEVPGDPASICWYYVAQDRESGSEVDVLTLDCQRSEFEPMLPAGEYTVFLLANDGYDVIASADFTVAGGEEAAEEPAAESKGFSTAEDAAAGKAVITGYTFVEGSTGFGGEGAENLWDGDTATKFCTNEFPVVSVAELDGVYTINGFTMATANDNADYNGRSPDDWTIYVSADGENWTELAKGDDSFFEETNFTYYAGDAAAEGVSYVKLEAASTPASLFQVSELNLLGEKTGEKGAVDEALDDKAEAPQTFDFGVIALVASALTAGAALSLKKRK